MAIHPSFRVPLATRSRRHLRFLALGALALQLGAAPAMAQSQGPVDLKLWGQTPADAGGAYRGVIAPAPAPAEPAPAPRVVEQPRRASPPAPRPTSQPRPAPEPAAPKPQAPRVTVPPTSLPAASAPTPTPTPQPVPAVPEDMLGYALVPLDPTGSRGTLLSGEYAVGRFSVLLPDAVAVDHAVLKLVYSNSVETSPDASALDVWINGQPVARLPLDAHRGPVTARIELPVEMLTVGQNRVDVIARQRHRLLCDIPSTYELWARLDNQASRLMLAVADDGPSLADFDSLITDPTLVDDPVAIVVADGFRSDGGMTAAAIAAQALAIRTGVSMPSFEMIDATDDTRLARQLSAPASADGPRRVIVVGSAPAIAGLVGEDPGDAGDGVLRLIRSTGGRSILVLTGRDTREAQLAARRFADQTRPLPGSDRLVADLYDIETRVPARPTPRIDGDASYSLAQLGYHTDPFDGLRQRIDLPVDMPMDLYVGDNSRVRIRLDAAYGANVGPRAEVAVLINGNFATALQLDAPGGALIENAELLAPLSMFQPGRNVISFETRLPGTPAFCGPDGVLAGPGGGGTAGGGAPRFTLFDTTTIEVPPVAHLASLPDLRVMAGTGFPYNRPGHDISAFHVVTPLDQPLGVTAAATVIARMARAAGVPMEPHFYDQMPRLRARDTLIVAPIARLGLDLVAAAPVGPELMGDLNRGRLPETIVEGDDAMATGGAESGPQLLQAQTARRLEARAAATSRWSEGLREEWQRRLGENAEDRGDGMIGWASRSWGWLRTQTRWILDETLPDRRSPETLFTEGSRPLLAVMQYAAPQDVGTTWTLVTAADDQRLLGGVRLLAADEAWDALKGGVATLASDGRTVATADGGPAYHVLTGEVGPFGVLSITASWFSRNVLIWAAVIALLIGTLGIATHILVRHSPRRPV
ncbi:cellulose biosynthesis cyclic di-GMP-binding regulatory protein BcsB [Tistrella mobilis]|uniref:cellulose biosynthesis cyclic di-GMP-binding regulatory protein BcsB n=1 Tax=Tistrella mobilis TaxID=171437 RepID=UPI003558FA62